MGVARRLWLFGIGVVLSGAFYLLLIDTTSLPELYVLAGVAVAASVAFVISREQAFTEARISLWWLLKGWRAVARIPTDIGILCLSLIHI